MYTALWFRRTTFAIGVVCWILIVLLGLVYGKHVAGINILLGAFAGAFTIGLPLSWVSPRGWLPSPRSYLFDRLEDYEHND